MNYMNKNLINKPWGHEEIIYNDKYVKKLLMKRIVDAVSSIMNLKLRQ